MEKQLIVVGNSLAFVVDKSLRSQLGISSKTRLRVVTDGVRLIIEPIRKEAKRAVSSHRDLPVKDRCFNAIRVLDALESLGLDEEKFVRLTGHRSNTYRTQLEMGLDDAPGRGLIPLQLAIDRLDACVDVLNTGGSWEQAIQAALSAVPITDAATPRG
jgi:hypothetical protein